MSGQLAKGFDTFGTQILAHTLSIFENGDALNIGFEFASGCTQRMAAPVAEHRGFATIFTFSHNTHLNGVKIR